MRILYYIDSLKMGGAEKLLIEMLESYKDQHEIHVSYFSDGPLREVVEHMQIPLTRLSKQGLKDPLAFVRSERLIRSFRPDVIHTHLSKSDIIGHLTGSLMRVPVRISTLHNVNPWRKNPLWSTFMRVATSSAHRIIAVSDTVASFTIEWSKVPPEKITIIDNGVDLEKFDCNNVTPIDVTRWNIAPEAYVIGIIGRLNVQKGHDIFLQMAKMLRASNPNIHFLIVGDGELRDKLEKQVNELGLQSDITFTGLLNEIPELLARLDILVFSSLWEGLPVTMLEAMAMQRAIVSTNVGGIPDVLEDQINGIMVQPGDAQILADACQQIINNPDLKQKLGKNARNTIVKDFDQKLMHRKILDLYTEILNTSRR